MERKSAFSRTLEYFETADFREASACIKAAGDILSVRQIMEMPAEPKPRRKRRINGEHGAETIVGETESPIAAARAKRAAAQESLANA